MHLYAIKLTVRVRICRRASPSDPGAHESFPDARYIERRLRAQLRHYSDISRYLASTLTLMKPCRMQSTKQSVVKSVCIWWIFGWAAESLWQYLFQLQSKASLVACAVALLSALYAFAHAYRNSLSLRPAITDFSPDALAKHVIVGSTAMNAAWLSVAASVGVLIAVLATTSIRLMPLAVAAAVTVAVVGAGVVLQTQGWVYGITLVWAFYGVSVKQHSHPVVQNVAYAAIAVLGLLSAWSVMQLARTRSTGAASPLLG